MFVASRKSVRYFPPPRSTDEFAVMIDARDPLDVAALECELPGYVDSWSVAAAETPSKSGVG